MTFRFVEAQNTVYPLTMLCRVLEVSRGGYCAWRKRQAQPSASRQRDLVLQAALSPLYQDELKKHGVIPSMNRRGQCWDNAVVESFFGSLKSEMICHCVIVRPTPK